jgi:hypothetical protein
MRYPCDLNGSSGSVLFCYVLYSNVYLTFSTPHPLLSPTLPFTSLLVLVLSYATMVVCDIPRVLPCSVFGASDSVLWPASGDDAGRSVSWWGKVLSTLPVNFSLCYTIVIHKQGTDL